jgi:hypothetical protein
MATQSEVCCFGLSVLNGRHKKTDAKSVFLLLENGSFLAEYGAQKKTRTSTVLPPHGPEPCASTNSAIWALN